VRYLKGLTISVVVLFAIVFLIWNLSILPGMVIDNYNKLQGIERHLQKLEGAVVERDDALECSTQLNGRNLDTLRGIMALEMGVRIDFMAEVGG